MKLGYGSGVFWSDMEYMMVKDRAGWKGRGVGGQEVEEEEEEEEKEEEEEEDSRRRILKLKSFSPNFKF
jgi:hypothetical protein